MKKTIRVVLLLAVAGVLTSCVTRTVSVEEGVGEKKKEKVLKKERIWFWQKEYHNPY